METSVGVDPVLDETGSGASTLADLGRGLVGYWPLDEGTGATAYDWSGSGDNGTLNASTTWGVGQVDGTAASFPSSSSANITTSPNNQVNINDNLTISFWLQGASTTGAYAAIVANDPTFTTGYMVARAATTTNVYIRLDTSAGTNQNGGVIGNAFNGNWNQVVWTISSGTVKGYLNGSLWGETAAPILSAFLRMCVFIIVSSQPPKSRKCIMRSADQYSYGRISKYG